MDSSSSSSSSAIFITREEFNAFHKFDRVLFTRLVVSLRRDIRQSFQVMSFLLYLEKNALLGNLIVNLVSLPDLYINTVANEVVMCLRCLSYEDFSAFVASLGQNTNSFNIPLITRMSGDYFTLAVIHQKRENILLEMKKHLTRICYPAFEDICVRAEMYMNQKMYSEEREKAMEKMSQLRISSVVHKAESSTSSQFLCGQQETTNHVAGPNKVEDQQVMEEDRTVFLTFSRGYPISEAEVHDYFTRRFGEIIEAIHMGEVGGNDQALYARMVLRSADKISEIVSDGVCRTKFTINGKHVKARRFIPNPKSLNNLLSSSYGVSL